MGANQWEARCPAHPDRTPSLRVSSGEGGEALIKCHAGCEFKQVMEALGLRAADSFPRSDRGPSRGERPDDDQLRPAIDRLARTIDGEFIAQYSYCEADGTTRFVIARYQTSVGKEIRPFFRTADGRWNCGIIPRDAGPAPLYNLRGIASASPIVFVEGEKCAELAKGIGLAATTCYSGGWDPKKTDFAPCSGKDVILVPDNDDEGERKMKAAAKALRRLAKPARTLTVRLPGLVGKGDDIEQWLDGLLEEWGPAERLAAFWAVVEEARSAKARGAAATSAKDTPCEHVKAVRWLMWLIGTYGPSPSRQVFEKAAEAGFAKRAIERAKGEANVESRQYLRRWLFQFPGQTLANCRPIPSEIAPAPESPQLELRPPATSVTPPREGAGCPANEIIASTAGEIAQCELRPPTEVRPPTQTANTMTLSWGEESLPIEYLLPVRRGFLVPDPGVISDWPESLREAFEERAGILEYDAGFTRAEAEARAFAEVRDSYGATPSRSA